MSVSVSDNRNPLAARAVRVRNRCLAVLAGRRSLPAPSEEDFASIGDGVSLSEALARWEKLHAPTVAIAPIAPTVLRPPRRWYQKPFAYKTASVAAAGLLGVVVGNVWRSRVAAQASDVVAEQRWFPVTDSVVAALNEKLLDVREGRVGAQPTLTAADVAALIARSPRRRRVPIDSIEARIDSLLWIRGRVRGGSSFELGGNVRVLRRGLAELHVTHFAVDGLSADSAVVARLVVGTRTGSVDRDRLRFELPSFVSALVMANGEALVRLRERQP